MKKVLVIGSTNVDLVARCNRFPKGGETVIGNNFETNLGGKGANQAVAASYTGADVTFLTCLGNDANGKFALNELKTLGVNVKPIIKESSTGTAIILVEEQGAENEIVIIGGANALFSCDDIDNNIDLIKESDYLLLQLEIPLNTINYILEIAAKYHKEVILNPAPFIKLDNDILKLITYITPNEGELVSLACSDKSYEDNATKLLEIGVKNVIVTLGNKGSSLINKNEKIDIKVTKVKAIDTTGAGDCYNGTFVGCLSLGYDLKKSLEIASYASAMSVTRKGASKSYQKLDKIIQN